MAKIASKMARSSQGLDPLMRVMTAQEGDNLFGLTGGTGKSKSNIQTAWSGVNVLRFALADGTEAGVRHSLPVWVAVVCETVQQRHFSHQLKALSFNFVKLPVKGGGGIVRKDYGVCWCDPGRTQRRRTIWTYKQKRLAPDTCLPNDNITRTFLLTTSINVYFLVVSDTNFV